VLAAESLAASKTFLALVDSFSAFASVVVVLSSGLAFVEYARSDPDRPRARAIAVGVAVNRGIAFGFLAGLFFAYVVYFRHV
jgi:hypothetical protein